MFVPLVKGEEETQKPSSVSYLESRIIWTQESEGEVTTVLEENRKEQQSISRTTCHICKKKTFRHISYLSSHLHIHSGARSYMCDTCGRSFNHKCNLHL